RGDAWRRRDADDEEGGGSVRQGVPGHGERPPSRLNKPVNQDRELARCTRIAARAVSGFCRAIALTIASCSIAARRTFCRSPGFCPVRSRNFGITIIIGPSDFSSAL